MKQIALTLFLMSCVLLRAQNVAPSNTYVRTCLNDIECASINSSSYLFYDEGNQKFYLKVDFNRIKTGVDSVDFWLADLSDTYFYFKGALNKEDFPTLSNYDTKNVIVNGESFLNGVWHEQTIELSIFRADNDMLNNTTNGVQFDAYKVNFSLSFSPKDFNIHKKPQRLTNNIFIGVGGGQINLLKSGMEQMVGEAYNRQ